MDVGKIPTTTDVLPWILASKTAAARAEALRPLTGLVKTCLAHCYTPVPVGVWVHPESGQVRIDAEDANVRSAVPGLANGLLKDANDADEYVKIAFSPALRRAGEYLNFFPGQYPGGMPNHHTPLAAMLTTGLVGGGLGYGLGWTAEQMLPQNFQRGKLRKTLGMIGGIAGAGLGSVPGLANLGAGKPFLSPNSPLTSPANATPDMGLKSADDDFGSSADNPSLAVNIDAMGRTLWSASATPQLIGTTDAILRTAERMPGGAEQGWVTPTQMGNLAAHMGAGYASGAMVGAALGVLTGMPQETQNTLKRTGAYAGLVRAVVPYLFGG